MTTDFLEGVKMAEQHAKTFRLTNKDNFKLFWYLVEVSKAFLQQAREARDPGLINKSMGFIMYKDRLWDAVIAEDDERIKIMTEDQEVEHDD